MQPNLRKAVCRWLTLVELKEQTVICNEGDIGDRLFVLIRGECDVYKANNRVNILRNGTVFGEAGIKSDDARRTATIICYSDCTLLTLHRAAYERLLKGVTSQSIADIHDFVGRSTPGSRHTLRVLAYPQYCHFYEINSHFFSFVISVLLHDRFLALVSFCSIATPYLTVQRNALVIPVRSITSPLRFNFVLILVQAL